MASKTATPLEFTGFPAAGFRLLGQLKKHNDRDWFSEHKTDYRALVEQPMEALVLKVASECRAQGLPLYAKDKNPVMRVYRDIRFSKDKTPYKTHVAAELRRSFSDSGMVLYLHFSPEDSFAGAGIWQPDRPVLHLWRESIAGDPGRFEKVISSLKREELQLHEENALSNMPRGYQNYSAKPFSKWLKLTSFLTTRKLSQADCGSPELIKKLLRFALAAKPLLSYGWEIEAKTFKTMP